MHGIDLLVRVIGRTVGCEMMSPVRVYSARGEVDVGRMESKG